MTFQTSSTTTKVMKSRRMISPIWVAIACTRSATGFAADDLEDQEQHVAPVEDRDRQRLSRKRLTEKKAMNSIRCPKLQRRASPAT